MERHHEGRQPALGDGRAQVAHVCLANALAHDEGAPRGGELLGGGHARIVGDLLLCLGGRSPSERTADLGEEWATAIYLDGFSPTRNPEVWTPEFVGRLAKTLAPGGVLATYSAAGHVRRALEAAGLRVERRPGAPGKRECLRAMKVGGE